MEELDEFDVLWPETCHTHEPTPPPPAPPSSSPVPVQAAQAVRHPMRPQAAARSRPVDVPGRSKAARSWPWNGHGPRDDDSGDHDDDNNGGGNDGSAIVPPHLLRSAGWRWPEAWTLRASVGPPCKRARDLRHLRDSVLRMTGFIEG